MAQSGWFTLFVNCSYCLNGELVDDHLVVSEESGLILKRTGYIGGDVVDLDGNILAPGFLELHTNGVNGFHFTHHENDSSYQAKLADTASYYVTQGVTGFWATIPTVAPYEFKKILPSLRPREFHRGASLLGAHAEGPYLSPYKKGAHNPSLFATPSVQPAAVYDAANLGSVVKLMTIAPELQQAPALIKDVVSQGIKISLGHSNATYAQGFAGLQAGATALTHTMNAMPPFHSREPGLAGLISLPDKASPVPAPYYSIIPDGHHLHPNTVSMLHRVAPRRSILVSDSIELSGMPDGLYPGHSQIPYNQRKRGDLATIDGTDTLIGGCISLQQGLRNLMKWSGCGIAEAVSTVTENVAAMMGIDGEGGRGVLKQGRRADLCVLSEEGEVLQTWIGGRKVWDKEDQ